MRAASAAAVSAGPPAVRAVVAALASSACALAIDRSASSNATRRSASAWVACAWAWAMAARPLLNTGKGTDTPNTAATSFVTSSRRALALTVTSGMRCDRASLTWASAVVASARAAARASVPAGAVGCAGP